MNDLVRVRGGQDVEELYPDGDDDRQLEPPGVLLPEGLDGPSLEQLHDDEREAVFRHVVVEDRHRAGVLDRVGDVPFAKKARAHVPLQGQVCVQQLDRELLAVPVGCSEHRRHAADAEDPVEVVLAAQHRAEPLLRPREDLFVRRHRPLATPPGRPQAPARTLILPDAAPGRAFRGEFSRTRVFVPFGPSACLRQDLRWPGSPAWGRSGASSCSPPGATCGGRSTR